jgi:hypothetical protein
LDGEEFLHAANSGTSRKAVLHEEIDGSKQEIDLPLTSNANIQDMASELHLPDYIDLDYLPMQSAITTLWACLRAPELHNLYPQAFEKKVGGEPIPALLFGGAAVKIHCEHANRKGSLPRKINDTDFIVPKKRGSDFVRLLINIDKAFGTQFKFFRTQGDVSFNAMRQGLRYRVRMINGIAEDGLPTVTRVDIFCDSINLRHKINIREFENYRENLYTIGLEPLLLSKCQFIMDTSKDDLQSLRESGQEFRILHYDSYNPDKIILGMEERDVRDVCALFLDHPIGAGNESIDPTKILRDMKAFSGIDKRTTLTLTLNLRNLMERTELLKTWLSKADIATVSERIEELLSHLPSVDEKWSKPWWNTMVETP